MSNENLGAGVSQYSLLIEKLSVYDVFLSL
jgi:hypothetical protein